MRPLVFILAAVLLSSGCRATPTWDPEKTLNAERDGCRVVTDGSEADLEAILVHWDEVRRRVHDSPLASWATPSRPVTVYAFSTSAGFKSAFPWWAPVGRAYARYSKSQGEAFVRTNRETSDYWRWFCERSVRHELFHHLHVSAQRHAPLWLLEGLADHFAADPRLLDITRYEVSPLGDRYGMSEDSLVLPWLQETVEAFDPASVRARGRAFLLCRTLLKCPSFVQAVLSGAVEDDFDTLLLQVGLSPRQLAAAYRETFKETLLACLDDPSR